MTGDDCREGLAGVISVKIPNPQFEGQTKTKLGNSEVEGIVKSIVGDALSTFFEENPSTATKLCDKLVVAAEAREAARKASELTRRKGALDFGLAPGETRRLPGTRPREMRTLSRRGRIRRRRAPSRAATGASRRSFP